MSSLWKRFDINPQIESYFKKHTVQGAFFSILAFIVSCIACIMVLKNGIANDNFMIDPVMEKQDELEISVHFDAIPCEFISTKVTNYYGESLKANIRESSLNKKGEIMDSYEWVSSSKAIPNTIITEIEKQTYKKREHKCVLPDTIDIKESLSQKCSTCQDYISLYQKLGYDPSKLIKQCKPYSFKDLPSYSCELNIKTELNGLKSMIQVDTTNFNNLISATDFEDDYLIKRLSKPKRIQKVKINGHELSIPSLAQDELNSLTIDDIDCHLIPIGVSSKRSFESSCKATKVPITFVNKDETPGIRIILNYSGLVKNDQTMTIIGSLLACIIICGGVLAIFDYTYRFICIHCRKSKQGKDSHLS